MKTFNKIRGNYRHRAASVAKNGSESHQTNHQPSDRNRLEAGGMMDRMFRIVALMVAVSLTSCAYEAPTSPTVIVNPPPIAAPSDPPPLPPPTPITLALSQGMANPRPGSGLTLRATPLTGQPSSPATYVWDFGDSTSATTNTAATGHVYARAGSYQARVSLTDATGRTAEASRTVIVTNPPPEPREPREQPEGLVAYVTCAAGDVGEDTGCQVRVTYNRNALPPSKITNVDWEWGDGQEGPGHGPAEKHTYDIAGTYVVWAHVTAQTSAGSRESSGQTSVKIEP